MSKSKLEVVITVVSVCMLESKLCQKFLKVLLANSIDHTLLHHHFKVTILPTAVKIKVKIPVTMGCSKATSFRQCSKHCYQNQYKTYNKIISLK